MQGKFCLLSSWPWTQFGNWALRSSGRDPPGCMGEWFNDLCFDFCTSLGQINRAGHILRAHLQQFRVTKGPLSAPNTFARVHRAKTIVQVLRSSSFFHSHFLTSEGGIFHLEEATGSMMTSSLWWLMECVLMFSKPQCSFLIWYYQ